MFTTLIYGGETYPNFEINENGDIRNRSTNHIYKKYINNKGYYVVTLPMGHRGVVKGIRVHKAIAETFIPNFMKGKYNIVNHIDENKLNIDLDNLEWCDNQANLLYYLENHPMANNRKLTADDVRFIRAHPEISSKKLAKEYGTSDVTIQNVRNNKYYRGIV